MFMRTPSRLHLKTSKYFIFKIIILILVYFSLVLLLFFFCFAFKRKEISLDTVLEVQPHYYVQLPWAAFLNLHHTSVPQLHSPVHSLVSLVMPVGVTAKFNLHRNQWHRLDTLTQEQEMMENTKVLKWAILCLLSGILTSILNQRKAKISWWWFFLSLTIRKINIHIYPVKRPIVFERKGVQIC